MGFVLLMSLYLINADFPICALNTNEQYPCTIFENGQYYVFWTDYRFYPIDSTKALFGSRIATDGTVLDPDGIELFNRQVDNESAVAYDGTNFLVVYQDSC
jgi:hypothetical protein